MLLTCQPKFHLQLAGGATTTGKVSSYTFFPGAKPFGPGSQKCRKLIVDDRHDRHDHLESVTSSTTVCGYSSEDIVFILNKGCAKILYGDNGEYGYYLL